MKKATKKIICAIFSLSLVFFSASNVFAKVSLKERADALINHEEKEKSDYGIASNRLNLQYESGALRDPFKNQPPKKEVKVAKVVRDVEPLPPLAVQGLVWGSALPQAIVNNKVCKVGDVIDGVRISKISKEGLKVYFNEMEYSVSAPALAQSQIPNNTEGGSK